MQQLARNAWQAILLTGIFSVILGVCVLVWPGPTLVIAGVLFGIYLVVSGVFQLLGSFATHVTAGMRVLAFISGLVSLVLGFLCFRSTFDSVLLLAIWIGIAWLFRGTATMIAAMSDPLMPARGWQGFFGLVSIAAGIVLLTWPLSSITVLTVVAGCWLIALGIMEAITAFQVRHTAESVANQL